MQLTLLAARKRRRLTLEALATKAGIHKSTVLRIERGDVRPLHETIQRLEAAMALEPGSLRIRKAS